MRHISVLLAALGLAVASIAASPPDVAPIGSPVRCVSVAAALEDSEHRSVRTGGALLALATDNGADPADIVRVQERVQTAQTNLARIQTVRARHAGLTADQVTLTHLNEQSVAALRAELAACASSAPASPPRSLTVTDFVREDGKDRAGNDIGVIEVPSRDFDACRAACSANAQCRAFTVYTPPPGDRGFCWMKSAAGPVTEGDHVISGVRQ